MGDVLSPWIGRLEKQEYIWRETIHSVKGHVASVDAFGNANHGFARLVDWRVRKLSENEAVATWELNEKEYAQKGYPFSIQYRITYKIDANGLTVCTSAKNVGKESAPFGLGYVVQHV
jgi:aldose 1-epimerase